MFDKQRKLVGLEVVHGVVGLTELRDLWPAVGYERSDRWKRRLRVRSPGTVRLQPNVDYALKLTHDRTVRRPCLAMRESIGSGRQSRRERSM